MLARTAVQPRVLVALIQCASMATEVVEVATESEEVSVFGKKFGAVCDFLAYFCAVLRFSDPLYAPLVLDYEVSSLNSS